MTARRFAPYAWGVLGYNVVVILWGAFVRATGSGAGCGRHWPLCNGEMIPRAPAVETLIELSHRITSGIALLVMIGLVWWAWHAYPKGHRVRKAALVSFGLIIVESLLGAGLVLLEYTASNVSVARAYWMAGHLVNTFLLLAALTLTAWWASGAPAMRLRGQPTALRLTLSLALLGMLILGASGAVTALGDTLVFTAGISPEDNALVAGLVDLRIYHPLIAFAVGGLLLLAAWTARRLRDTRPVNRLSLILGVVFVFQLVLGAFNVVLKAPVTMQLLHLLFSDAVWIALTLLVAATLAKDAMPVTANDETTSATSQLAERGAA